MGIITTWIDWKAILSSILPFGEFNNGYIVVLENACSSNCSNDNIVNDSEDNSKPKLRNQHYTFRIDGPDVTVIDSSNIDSRNSDDNSNSNRKYDPAYDSMKITFHLNELYQEAVRGEGEEGTSDIIVDRKKNGVDSDDGSNNHRGNIWNDEYCPYSIHVYPSLELENLYYSNAPIRYTLAVALIFISTTIVFLLYDCFVEGRQKRVMDVALESRAIISSLFPAVVRDRLFQQKRTTARSPQRQVVKRAAGKAVTRV